MLPGLSLKFCVSDRLGFLGTNDGRCASIPVFCSFGGMRRCLFLLSPLDEFFGPAFHTAQAAGRSVLDPVAAIFVLLAIL